MDGNGWNGWTNGSGRYVTGPIPTSCGQIHAMKLAVGGCAPRAGEFGLSGRTGARIAATVAPRPGRGTVRKGRRRESRRDLVPAAVL